MKPIKHFIASILILSIVCMASISYALEGLLLEPGESATLKFNSLPVNSEFEATYTNGTPTMETECWHSDTCKITNQTTTTVTITAPAVAPIGGLSWAYYFNPARNIEISIPIWVGDERLFDGDVEDAFSVPVVGNAIQMKVLSRGTGRPAKKGSKPKGPYRPGVSLPTQVPYTFTDPDFNQPGRPPTRAPRKGDRIERNPEGWVVANGQETKVSSGVVVASENWGAGATVGGGGITIGGQGSGNTNCVYTWTSETYWEVYIADVYEYDGTKWVYKETIKYKRKVTKFIITNQCDGSVQEINHVHKEWEPVRLWGAGK